MTCFCDLTCFCAGAVACRRLTSHVLELDSLDGVVQAPKLVEAEHPVRVRVVLLHASPNQLFEGLVALPGLLQAETDEHRQQLPGVEVTAAVRVVRHEAVAHFLLAGLGLCHEIHRVAVVGVCVAARERTTGRVRASFWSVTRACMPI